MEGLKEAGQLGFMAIGLYATHGLCFPSKGWCILLKSQSSSGLPMDQGDVHYLRWLDSGAWSRRRGLAASRRVPQRAVIICSPAKGRRLSASSHLWIPYFFSAQRSWALWRVKVLDPLRLEEDGGQSATRTRWNVSLSASHKGGQSGKVTVRAAGLLCSLNLN